MQAEPYLSWWRELFVPAFFTVLGAALGFFASQLRDYWKAKRAKQSFLRAVGMELDALGHQLDEGLSVVKRSTEALEKGSNGPRYSTVLRTSVFDGQIGKLRDVDDELMIKLIHFYSDLRAVEKTIEAVHDYSAEFDQATPEKKGRRKEAATFATASAARAARRAQKPAQNPESQVAVKTCRHP